MVFYTYVDWTLEDPPRAFYVGKGTEKRLNERERNAYWKHIAAKYGWRREPLFATKDEAYALVQEILGILELKTFENGVLDRWGANLTAGGEGITGHRRSEITRLKISQSISGCNHYNYGRRLSLSTREKLSFAHNGKSLSDAHRAAIAETMRGDSNCMRGRTHTEEAKTKMRTTPRRKTWRKLTPEKVLEILASSETHLVLARRLGVSKTTIKNVRRQRPTVLSV